VRVGFRFLDEVIKCLNAATAGCTALMDITEEKLNSTNATLASYVCNVTLFAGPTTVAPLPLYAAITVPTTTTTTQAVLAVVLGGTLSCSPAHFVRFLQFARKVHLGL